MRSEEPVVDGMACVVSLTHQVRDIPVGMGPEGIAVDAAGRRAFVACSRSVVTGVRLDGEPGPWQAGTGREPMPVIFDPPAGRLFTADARSDTVTALDAATGRQLGRIPVGSYPAGLGHHPGLRRLYCGDTAAGTVTVIDVDTLRPLGRIAVRACPGKLVIDQVAGHLYLASFLNDRLTCISLDTGVVIGELPVERAPAGFCVSPGGRWLYVCNRDAGTISVLDARSGTESRRQRVRRLRHRPGDRQAAGVQRRQRHPDGG